jgi:hypothetical protein
MIRHMTGVGMTGLLLVAVLYHPGIAAAHGGADMEQDPCMRLAGESMVHFSAYQPQYGLKINTARRFLRRVRRSWSWSLWTQRYATGRLGCGS